MWFHKAKDKKKDYPHPGNPYVLDGHRAAWSVETIAGEAIVLQAAPDLAEMAGPLRRLTPTGERDAATKTSEAATAADAIAKAVGQSLAGVRSAVMITGFGGAHEHLAAAAGKRLPIVVHLTCKEPTRQAGSLSGGHGDYHAVADAGCVQLFAKDAQEVADFALIARRIAELSLTPCVVAQDLYDTSHATMRVLMAGDEFVDTYLGRAGDAIDAPTEAQKILFGEKRRRVPRLVDPDHPAGIGGVQDRESYFKGIVSARAFFASAITGATEQAMREFGELTGRYYEAVAGYRVDDAAIVVLAQGAVIDALRPVVDHLRDNDMVKAGLIDLSMLRPFPGARLSEMLKGKRAVTVLERTDVALADDLPLATEVRAAIDRATENGAAEKNPPHAGYAGYRRPEDRPAIYAGVYGVGRELPDFAELLAVFRNMLPDGQGKLRFYVGADFTQDTRRFPQLQMLQQHLNQAYPDLRKLSLPPVDVKASPKRKDRAAQLLSLSAQGGLFAGNIFAQALAESLDRDVRTFPEGGLEPSLQPASLTILHAAQGEITGARPFAVDAVLVSDDRLIEQLASRSRVNGGGTLLVGSGDDPATLWQRLSNRTAQWIREASLDFYVMDAHKIASETTSHPTFVDQLTIWSLLGAWLHVSEKISDADADGVIERLRGYLERIYGEGDRRTDEIIEAVRRGSKELLYGDWRAWGEERPVRAEPETPWNIRSAGVDDETVFDPTRFWHSVGYLYDSGQAEHALADPFVATGVLPARTSASRDMTAYRLQLPYWFAENCTGCALCWTHCPESALPPSLHTITSILDTAMSQCGKAGTAIVQMRRVSDPLAKQAYQLASKEGPGKYTTAGALLDAAFGRLVEKMKITGDPLAALTAEFDAVREYTEDYPIAKTAVFFDELEKTEKGSGRLLSIAVNPLSCTGCGICIEECPDGALAWGDQEASRISMLRKNLEVQLALPAEDAAFVNGLVADADPDTEMRRLLDATAYGSVVGGDGSSPGNAAKTAVHLVSAAVESFMAPRFDAHVQKLSDLIERIEAKIQGDVESVAKINDFEAFTQRLNRFARKEVTAESLSKLIGDNGDHEQLDTERLRRLGEALGALKTQRRSYTGQRARMIMAIDGYNGPFWSGTYPYNPHRHPWAHHLPGDAPALAAGIVDGIVRTLADEIAVVRRAELELDDQYDPAVAFDVKQITDEEWQLMPPVVVIGADGVTRWDEISKLLATGNRVTVVIIDRGASIIEGGRNPALLAVADGSAFVTQASVGHPGHLMRGVARGLTTRRPALVHVYAPDPNHGIAPEQVVRQARLAYRSRAFPLFTFDPDGDGLALEENPDADVAWAEHALLVKDASGSESTVPTVLTVADWAIGEARFSRFFDTVPKGHLNDEMKPLADYLALPEGEREGLKPFIHVVDAKQRHALAMVAPEMVQATERASRQWQELRKWAATPAPEADTTAAAAKVEAPPAPAAPVVDAMTYERMTQRLLELAGYGRDTDFFKRSLKEFVTESRETAEE